MPHPKTIESYDNLAGNQAGDYKKRFEKGHDVAVEAKKALIEKDPNKQTKILSVYRIRTEDNSEYICWSEEISGKSQIGNIIKYELGWDDICRYYIAIPRKEIVFDVEKQEQIVKEHVDDLSQMEVKYLYPFNKENIKIIQDKISLSANKRCPTYVRDGTNGETRTVAKFSDWSTKPFEWLIENHEHNASKNGIVQQAYH